jgi:hypothetical protein
MCPLESDAGDGVNGWCGQSGPGCYGMGTIATTALCSQGDSWDVAANVSHGGSSTSFSGGGVAAEVLGGSVVTVVSGEGGGGRQKLVWGRRTHPGS